MGTCALIFVQLSAVTVEKRSSILLLLFSTMNIALALSTASGIRGCIDAGVALNSSCFCALDDPCDLGDELRAKAR